MHTQFRMIDVGGKPITHRLAVASGEIHVGGKAFALIRDKQLPKGDVLMLAEVAAITGAKRASEMIPLCHPMPLDQVRLVTDLDENTNCVRVYCFASTHARTGVEMEALAGVNAALLTIWDLTKMVEPDLRIQNIRLLAKRGGKSGLWLSEDSIPQWIREAVAPTPGSVLAGVRAAVLTLSDRASRGDYEDHSGSAVQQYLEQHGASVVERRIIPDDQPLIEAAVRDMMVEDAPMLLICTGGTGVSARDVTPEAIRPLLTREIPGVGELLRKDGATYTPLSWSSRSLAGIIEKTLVVLLPGNPSAVKEGLSALLPDLLPHLLKIMKEQPS
jgi:molybdenum cofactor biosynthesis protein MoaC